MAGEKILVVDDTKIVCLGFQKELTREGYEVDYVLSGEEALGKVRSKEYDLIFMDMVMPGGMDGITTCRAIKEIKPDVILVFMTGKLDKDLTSKEAEFTKAGGKVYYLYKPFSEGEILEVTQKALAER